MSTSSAFAGSDRDETERRDAQHDEEDRREAEDSNDCEEADDADEEDEELDSHGSDDDGDRNSPSSPPKQSVASVYPPAPSPLRQPANANANAAKDEMYPSPLAYQSYVREIPHAEYVAAGMMQPPPPHQQQEANYTPSQGHAASTASGTPASAVAGTPSLGAAAAVAAASSSAQRRPTQQRRASEGLISARRGSQQLDAENGHMGGTRRGTRRSVASSPRGRDSRALAVIGATQPPVTSRQLVARADGAGARGRGALTVQRPRPAPKKQRKSNHPAHGFDYKNVVVEGTWGNDKLLTLLFGSAKACALLMERERLDALAAEEARYEASQSRFRAVRESDAAKTPFLAVIRDRPMHHCVRVTNIAALVLGIGAAICLFLFVAVVNPARFLLESAAAQCR